MGGLTRLTARRVRVVVDMRLVRMLSLRIVVRRVSVLKGRMVVIVHVCGHKMLRLPRRAAAAVVANVHVLVVVHCLIVPVHLEVRRHVAPP